MLEYDPSRRLTASECLSHDYFQVRFPFPLNANIEQEENIEVENSLSMTKKSCMIDQMEVYKNIAKENEKKESKQCSSEQMIKNARYKPGVRTMQKMNINN